MERYLFSSKSALDGCLTGERRWQQGHVPRRILGANLVFAPAAARASRGEHKVRPYELAQDRCPGQRR